VESRFTGMTSELAIERIVSPVPAAEWDTLYARDEDAMPTQSRSWARAVEASGRYRDCGRLYCFSDGLRAMIPIFSRRFPELPFTSQRSLPPAWGYGGPVASKPITARHLRLMMGDLQRGFSVQIRPNPLRRRLWEEATPEQWVRLPRTSHVLDLAGGWDVVWSERFSSAARNKVRRGIRGEIEVEAGSSPTLVRDFYSLFDLSLDRWGRRQREPIALARWRGHRRDPLSKFLSMSSMASELFRIWVARIGSEPIAAIVVLQDRVAHYTRGAMNERLAGKSGANYLLHSLAIRQACEAGCKHYHMGETGTSVSLAQFKRQFGAVPVDYSEYRHEKLPISWIDRTARTMVKRAVGFRDA